MRKKSIAILLTVLGLIPFLFLSIAYAFDLNLNYLLISRPQQVVLFVTYASVILSFLAGIHWGIAVSNKTNTMTICLLVSSNIIALLAWLTLIIPITKLTLCLLVIGFCIQLIIDYRLQKSNYLSSWFFNCRVGVTSAVIITLLLVIGT